MTDPLPPFDPTAIPTVPINGGDVISVDANATDAKGGKLELEELPAARVQTTQVPVSLGGQIVGALPGAFQAIAPVGVFANGLRQQCSECKHFSNLAWLKFKERIKASDADDGAWMILNELRASLHETEDPNLLRTLNRHRDVGGDLGFNALETAIREDFGLCMAQTEIFRGFDASPEVIVHCTGACPDSQGPRGEDLSKLFQISDRAAAKRADAKYDRMLFLGRGKTT